MTQASRNDAVWVLAEQGKDALLPVSYELLARGRPLADALGTRLCAVLLGPALSDGELGTLIEGGADDVLAMEHADLTNFLVEPRAANLALLIRERRPSIVLAAATTSGRTLMPYLAIKLGTGLTADCTELSIDPDTGDMLQTRPAIGGNIMATIRTARHRPQMATVRPHATRPLPRDPRRHGRIERLSPTPNSLRSRCRHLRFEADTAGMSLEEAEIVVTVGRGIRTADRLPLVNRLADVLGAAVGATREVVDRGWMDYPHQIGLSGKTVTPKLYIALGVSGAIQHLAGMQTSETIIAINSDPDAQIMRVAELGIVGDLFDVVPALIERLEQAGPQPAHVKHQGPCHKDP